MSQLRKSPLERVRSGSGDLDRYDLAEKSRRAVEMHDPEVRRAAGDAAFAVDRLDEHLVSRADERLVAAALPLLLVAVQHVQPALLLGFGDVVREADRRGARPR
jgi:hypothetical protein